MDNLRNIIRKNLSEAVKKKYYTTWKKLVSEDRADIDSSISDIVKKVAKNLGIKKYSEAGSGTQGYAFYISNNKILKITTDRGEVIEAKKIQGKSCKHLSNVYSTHTLQGKYNGVYVIVCELLNKDEKIDEASYLLDSYFMNEYGLPTTTIITDYGDDSESLKQIIDELKSFFTERNKQELILWFFKGMIGIIEELKKYNVNTTEYVAVNLGIKRDGNLAMYDYGYSSANDNNTDVMHIDEEIALNPMDYPDFLDPQYNSNMGNSPYPPLTNPNQAPMREANISPEELNKKNLPLQYHNLWSEFLESNSEALGDILPTLSTQYSNLETLDTVKSVQKDNPALYDEFADWIFKALEQSRQK